MGAGQRPNLVLGLAERLGWQDLRPFVESISQTSFAGEVRLFVTETDEHTLAMLRQRGIVVEHFRHISYRRRGEVVHAYEPPLQRFGTARLPALYPHVLRALAAFSSDRIATQARLAAPLSIPYVARFLRFYRFLASSSTRYRNVMLTDVRDVFFQGDPFDFEIGDQTHCFLEDERHTLASEPHNRTWIASSYGEAALTRIGHNPISCSGVTIGPSSRVLEYLRVMASELLALPRQSVGIDQGVHNYAIYTHLVRRVRLIRNGEGPVLTLALVPQPEVEKAIANGGLGVAVLHQYNHHPRLAQKLLSTLS